MPRTSVRLILALAASLTALSTPGHAQDSDVDHDVSTKLQVRLLSCVRRDMTNHPSAKNIAQDDMLLRKFAWTQKNATKEQVTKDCESRPSREKSPLSSQQTLLIIEKAVNAEILAKFVNPKFQCGGVSVGAAASLLIGLSADVSVEICSGTDAKRYLAFSPKLGRAEGFGLDVGINGQTDSYSKSDETSRFSRNPHVYGCVGALGMGCFDDGSPTGVGGGIGMIGFLLKGVRVRLIRLPDATSTLAMMNIKARSN